MAEAYTIRAKRWFSQAWKSNWLAHAGRTGVAATVSLAVASCFKLPEAYWAAVTTIIVTQSTLGAAWAVSKQRLIGTALGAAAGALLVSYVAPGLIIFGLAIFALGLVCALLHLERSAYRFAGITLTIIMLIPRAQAPGVTGLHRFIEVSIGIAVGLAFAALWPLRE